MKTCTHLRGLLRSQIEHTEINYDTHTKIVRPCAGRMRMVCQYHTLKSFFLNFDILIEKCNRLWSNVRKLMFRKKFSSNFNEFFSVKNIIITSQV